MTMPVSRRSMIGGLGAGFAQLLLTRRIEAVGVLDPLTGKPGQLDLTLTAFAPNILRIAIAPVNEWKQENELGILAPAHAEQLLSRQDPVMTDLSWGNYRIALEEDPLRVAVTAAERNFRQQIQFDTDSTAVRLRVGDAPILAWAEPAHLGFTWCTLPHDQWRIDSASRCGWRATAASVADQRGWLGIIHRTAVGFLRPFRNDRSLRAGGGDIAAQCLSDCRRYDGGGSARLCRTDGVSSFATALVTRLSAVAQDARRERRDYDRGTDLPREKATLRCTYLSGDRFLPLGFEYGTRFVHL